MGDHLWTKVCRLAGAQHGVVSRADLELIGISPGRMRHLVDRGQLVRRGRWSYVVAGTSPGWHQDLLAMQHDVDGVVSHRAAAALWGFDTFEPGWIELSIHMGRRIRRAGATLHVATELDVDRVQQDAFHLTSPTRTLLDLAGVVRRWQLEHAVDGALRDGLVTVDGLWARLDERRGSGRGGVRAMEAVLDGRGGTGTPESVLERAFLRLVEEHGLPSPRVQVVHPAEGGDPEIRVDVQWDDARLIVELDGHGSHATRSQRAHDAERANRLRLDGWTVLRFTYEQVLRRPWYVVATLRRALHLAA